MVSFFSYISYMSLRRYRRTRARVDSHIFFSTAYALIAYVVVTIFTYTGVQGDPVKEFILLVGFYSVGFPFLGSLVYTFRRMEQIEMNLEAVVEEKSMQLVESEKLANIGKGVTLAEREIRNPLALINQATHLSEMEELPGDDLIRVTRENLSRILETLDKLRSGEYLIEY